MATSEAGVGGTTVGTSDFSSGFAASPTSGDAGGASTGGTVGLRNDFLGSVGGFNAGLASAILGGCALGDVEETTMGADCFLRQSSETLDGLAFGSGRALAGVASGRSNAGTDEFPAVRVFQKWAPGQIPEEDEAEAAFPGDGAGVCSSIGGAT